MYLNRTIASLALAASLGLAACGGSAGADSGLSRTDLAAKADSICAKEQASADAVPTPASLADADVAAAYFDQVSPGFHKEMQDLAALEPART